MLNVLNNYIFIVFLLGLALSNNLILFFISWVGLNMALYAILLKSYNSYSVEMTLKYFISGAIITIFLLISILFYFIEFF
jgi:NADH:ubiquinone oxidoreductase subunit 2 (subunit N)